MTPMPWLDRSTVTFLGCVDSLADDAFARPSTLPGWTRSHLVAHVHHNAEALMHLVTWAVSGVETPMYQSAGQRNADIEAGARWPVPQLRSEVHASADRLAEALASMSEQAWAAEVTTAQGRVVPATEIVWMRTREVAVHAVDLDAGIGFEDLEEDLAAALAHDAVTRRAARGEAAPLAAWLTGRTDRAPQLGPWL